MRARPLYLATAALAAMSLTLRAEDAKNYSYRSSAKAQSADEMEDLGEIAAAPDGGTEGDGKSALPDPAPVKRKFRFNVQARSEFTTNAILSGDHSNSDVLFLPTVEAGYNTPLGKYFTFDLAAKVESALFADHSDRGFLGYSANATLDFRPRPNLPRVYISAEPYRYDSFDTGDKVTQAVGLTAGTDGGFAFNGGRSLLYAGYAFSHYIADPSIDDRHAHRVTLGVAHQFQQKLIGQLYYAFQYNDYTSISRHDTRHMVGANLVYQFTERLFGNVTSALVDNESNADRASYQSFTASVGLTLQF